MIPGGGGVNVAIEQDTCRLVVAAALLLPRWTLAERA
jgi:hypothetical protein